MAVLVAMEMLGRWRRLFGMRICIFMGMENGVVGVGSGLVWAGLIHSKHIHRYGKDRRRARWSTGVVGNMLGR